jgi:PIN domain nuclease of toxin-antitoxin system
MSRVFLDTHVVVWLFCGEVSRLSKSAKASIETSDIVISPAVKLELSYLHEIGRLQAPADVIVRDLAVRIGVQIDGESFERIIEHALRSSWTRDVFDRLIVAHAQVNEEALVSKDTLIRKNYNKCIW